MLFETTRETNSAEIPAASISSQMLALPPQVTLPVIGRLLKDRYRIYKYQYPRERRNSSSSSNSSDYCGVGQSLEMLESMWLGNDASKVNNASSSSSSSSTSRPVAVASALDKAVGAYVDTVVKVFEKIRSGQGDVDSSSSGSSGSSNRGTCSSATDVANTVHSRRANEGVVLVTAVNLAEQLLYWALEGDKRGGAMHGKISEIAGGCM